MFLVPKISHAILISSLAPKVPVNRFGIAEATPEVRGFLKNLGGGGNKRMAYLKGMAGGGNSNLFIFTPKIGEMIRID